MTEFYYIYIWTFCSYISILNLIKGNVYYKKLVKWKQFSISREKWAKIKKK